MKCMESYSPDYKANDCKGDLTMPMIKNKALIHELFDLLREIRDDAEFAADVADCLEDEDGFRSMIEFLNSHRGNVTVGQALYEAAMIWQDKQPDDFFEDDDKEQVELSPEEKKILHAICDACDNNNTVRVVLKDGTIYTHAVVTDISFANDEEEFVIRTKERDTDSFVEQTLKFDDVEQVAVYYYNRDH